MSLAIIINLIAITVVVGGWTLAVWAFYNHLDDAYAKPRATRQPAVASGTDSDSRPATREDVRRAA